MCRVEAYSETNNEAFASGREMSLPSKVTWWLIYQLQNSWLVTARKNPSVKGIAVILVVVVDIRPIFKYRTVRSVDVAACSIIHPLRPTFFSRRFLSILLGKILTRKQIQIRLLHRSLTLQLTMASTTWTPTTHVLDPMLLRLNVLSVSTVMGSRYKQ